MVRITPPPSKRAAPEPQAYRRLGKIRYALRQHDSYSLPSLAAAARPAARPGAEMHGQPAEMHTDDPIEWGFDIDDHAAIRS
jgi:hypothetical protein